MGDINTARVSALDGHYQKGHFGVDAKGVSIVEVSDLVLWQLAVWPDTVESAFAGATQSLNLPAMPGYCQSVTAGDTSVLRIEPLKFWVHGVSLESLDAEQSVVLDLSHSRTQLRITGPQAATLLNGYLPIDLRESSFPVGSVASTAFHHVGVTLWRSADGYELFLPRGFALSLWELLQESALQYGLTVE